MKKSSTSRLTLAAAAAGFFLATSGFAFAADSQNKGADALLEMLIAKTTEYFCCKDNVKDPVCVGSCAKCECPGGYTKVVNETCEKGERGCNL